MKNNLLRSSALIITASLALGVSTQAASASASPTAHAAKKKTKKKHTNAQLRWMEKQIGPKKTSKKKGKRASAASVSAASIDPDFEQIGDERALNLVRSYDIPENDPSAKRMANLSWTYDSAITAAAFISAGNIDGAAGLLGQLSQLQRKDGSIAFAFNTATGSQLTQQRSGTVATLGLAAMFYHEATCSTEFDAVAVRATQWLLSQQGRGLGGMVAGGPDVDWASTQHNIMTRSLYSHILNGINNSKCPLDLTGYRAGVEPVSDIQPIVSPDEALPAVLMAPEVQAIAAEAAAKEAAEDQAAKEKEAAAYPKSPNARKNDMKVKSNSKHNEQNNKDGGKHDEQNNKNGDKHEDSPTQDDVNAFYGTVKESMYMLDRGIEEHLYEGNYRFRQGVKDDTTALDAQTYGIMWLLEQGRVEEASRVTQFSLKTMYSPAQSIIQSKDLLSWNVDYSSGETYQGFKPYAGEGSPDVIWMEGTYQMRYVAAAYGYTDAGFDNSLRSWSKLTYPAGPLQASATSSSSFNEYHVWPSAAAAAWSQLAGLGSDFLR